MTPTIKQENPTATDTV